MPEFINNSDVEFCGTLAGETEKCWFVNDGEEDIPIPKSRVVTMQRIGRTHDYIFVIPQWLAKKKGII